jgi:tripartite-type tricarboxylate transporter receptor subunit TctC
MTESNERRHASLPRRVLLGATVGSVVATRAQGSSRAPGTDYPSKPVQVICSLAAGGNADITARLISGALSAQTGQQFLVENRPSGGGLVALQALASAAPDGYTLFVGALSSHALNVGLYRNLPVHPLHDIEQVTISSTSPLALAVRAGFPARDVRSFRDVLHGKPGECTYGSSGNGTTGHIAAALLCQQLGVRAQHIPYRGSAAAFSDLSGGRIDFQVDTVSFLAPQRRADGPQVLMIGAKQRSPMMPEVPSAPESGLPEYESQTWTPWSAPKSTPAPILQFLYEQIQLALVRDDVLGRLRQLGNDPMPGMTPEKSRRFVASEIERWVPIVRASGAAID